MIEAGLYAHLCADSAVAAIVGTRIYPLKVPQGKPLPAITYRRIGTDEPHSYTAPLGLVFSRFHVACWAQDEAGKDAAIGAKLLAAAVRAALNGYEGTMGSVTVQDTTIDNEYDLVPDDTQELQDKQAVGVIFDVSIIFNA